MPSVCLCWTPHPAMGNVGAMYKCLLALLLAASATFSQAQAAAPSLDPTLAFTPPMGWNSWDSYGLTITETQFAGNVDILAARLKPFGWRYAVIDEGWYLGNPEAAAKPETLHYTFNALGQYDPAPNRFPSAANGAGLKPIADRVHAKGLLFGLHVIRGIPKQTVSANTVIGNVFHATEAADQTDTCPWNPDNFGVRDNPAGQAWYDALIGQYASWGVDYLKVDCIAAHPYKAAEIAMIHRAILKSGRPIVLSLSPGPTALANAAEVAANAQLWRISDDVWDIWSRDTGQSEFPRAVKAQFATIAAWQPYAGTGSWPDADMLPLGELRPAPGYGSPRSTRLTPAEQRTLITLWAIVRSPLFFGGNLTLLDPATEALLTNPEILAVNQQGHRQHLLLQQGTLVAWTSEGSSGQTYFALFNLGDVPATVRTPLAAYGFTHPQYRIRNLWRKDVSSETKAVAETILPHDCLLLELR